MSAGQAVGGPETPATPSTGWRDRLSPLRGGDLRLVWLAQVVSQLGDGMFTVGIVLLMIELTGSGLALSGTLIAQLLPYAILGAAAGALADRWNRRTTMVVSDIVRGLVVVLIPVLDVAGLLRAWMVPCVAFLLTSAGQFFDPSKNALVPAIVPREGLVRANALLSGTRQVMFTAGPAIGGPLISAFGLMSVFWLDAVTFVASAVILLRLRSSGHVRAAVESHDAEKPKGKLLDDIRDGLHFAWRNPVLRMLLIFGTAVNFLLSPLPVIIPLFFRKVLVLSPAGFGPALSVIFAGFLLGVSYVGVRGQRLRMGRLTIIAMGIAGMAAVIIGIGPPLVVILGVGLIGGAAIGSMEIAQSTILQRESTDELRGRVFALYGSVSQGGRAVSVALAGAVSEWAGLRPMFYVTGILTVLCAVALASSRTVRALR